MKISEMIKRSGLRDAEIARRSGVHRATIGRYRRGDFLPETPASVAGLSRALGVPAAKIRPDWAKVFAD